MKRAFFGTAAAALTMAGSVAMAAPAQAQPLVTGGLVNVTITDVLNDNNVEILEGGINLGAAIGVAANVCDVPVAVLARQFKSGGATCTAAADGQRVDIVPAM